MKNINCLKKIFSLLIILIIFITPCVVLPRDLNAQETKSTLKFQGKLVKKDGTNIDSTSLSCINDSAQDNCNFKIEYHDSEAYGGATLLYEEYLYNQELGDNQGIFTLGLGTGTAGGGGSETNFPNIFLNNDSSYYIVKLDTDNSGTYDETFEANGGEAMAVRAAPYAINANNLGGLDSDGYIKNQIVQQSSANFNIDGNGKVANLYVADGGVTGVDGGVGWTFDNSGGNISTDGNVGIGDSTPLSLLTVGSGDALQINSSGEVVSGTWKETASVESTALTDTGTIGFEWVDAEIADNLTLGTVSGYPVVSNGVRIGVDDTSYLLDASSNGTGSARLYIGDEEILVSGDIDTTVQSYDVNTTILGNTIELGTETTGSYVKTLSTGVGISGSGTGVGSTPSISLQKLGDLTVSGTGLSGGGNDVLAGDDSFDASITLITNKDIVAGGGLTGGADNVLPGGDSDVTIEHALSSMSNTSNSGNTFIQNINFDSYGHVSSVSTSSAIINEVDPIYSGDPASGITNTNISNWNTAYNQRGSVIGGTGLSWDGSELDIDNPFNPSGTYPSLRAQATTKGDVGLGNVENIALSTWSGSTNITTLGTITNGVWNGSVIGSSYISEADPIWVGARDDYFKLSDNEVVTGRPAFNGGTSGSFSPFTVDSNSKVINLNADLLDGQDGSYYLDDTDTTYSAGNDLDLNSGVFSLKNDIDVNTVRATGVAGLQLYDDGGNGIFIEDGGNVGIGTSSPSYLLDLQPASGVSDLFRIRDDTGANVLGISDVQMNVDVPASFNTAGDVEMAYDLYMSNTTASTISSNSSLYLEAGDSFEAQDVVLRSAGTGDVVMDSDVIFQEDLILNSLATGAIGDNLGFSSTSSNTLIRAGSSAKYKHDIHSIAFDWNKFMQLRPVGFKWNEDTATPNFEDIGFIAEEMNDLYPQLTVYDESDTPDGVRYNLLGVLSIAAIKDQQRMIMNLQDEVSMLSGDSGLETSLDIVGSDIFAEYMLGSVKEGYIVQQNVDGSINKVNNKDVYSNGVVGVVTPEADYIDYPSDISSKELEDYKNGKELVGVGGEMEVIIMREVGSKIKRGKSVMVSPINGVGVEAYGRGISIGRTVNNETWNVCQNVSNYSQIEGVIEGSDLQKCYKIKVSSLTTDLQNEFKEELDILNTEYIEIGKVKVQVEMQWYESYDIYAKIGSLLEDYDAGLLGGSEFTGGEILSGNQLIVGDSKITGDSSGNLITVGDIEVGGILRGSNGDLTVQLGDSDGLNKFEIENSAGESVFAVDSEGKIQTTDKISGSGVLLTGEGTVWVENSAVDSNSNIFITSTSSTCGNGLYISRQTTDQGFEVKLDGESCTNDIKFKWWIVSNL